MNNKAIVVLFLTVFIDLVGFGIVLPLLPLYADQFGAKPNEATLLVAIYSLMQFFFAPIWGSLSDRYGRRPILLLSLAGSVIAYIGLGVANSLWILFVARGLAGVMAGNIAAAQAYIADITTPANRARGMGMLGAAFGLGFILGPAIGGILAGIEPQKINSHLPSFFAAGLSLLAFTVALILLPESLNPEIKAKIKSQPNQYKRLVTLLKVLHHPQISLLIGMYFLVAFAFSAMESIFALWCKQQLSWEPQQIGYSFGFMGVVSTIIQGGLIGFLRKNFGEMKLLVLGLSALALGFLLITFSKTLPLLLAAITLLTGGISVSQPTLSSLISRYTAADQQGKTLGVASSTSALARIGGPAWAGFSFTLFGSSSPFLSGALAILVALVLSLQLTKNALVPDTRIVSKPES